MSLLGEVENDDDVRWLIVADTVKNLSPELVYGDLGAPGCATSTFAGRNESSVEIKQQVFET